MQGGGVAATMVGVPSLPIVNNDTIVVLSHSTFRVRGCGEGTFSLTVRTLPIRCSSLGAAVEQRESKSGTPLLDGYTPVGIQRFSRSEDNPRRIESTRVDSLSFSFSFSESES